MDGSAHRKPRCCGRIPLALLAVLLVALEVLEAVAPLYGIHAHGWQRTFVAGLMLKLLLLRLALFFAEGVMRCRVFACLGVLGRPLEVFVHGNRLARDLFISSFIFWTLLVGVVVNTLNEVWQRLGPSSGELRFRVK